MYSLRRIPLIGTILALISLLTLAAGAQPERPDITQGRETAVSSLSPLATSPCIDGKANNTYPCDGVDLLSFFPISQIGGGEGSDSWGWTDPETGREYALMTRTNGVAFVDVTDPFNAVYLGNLPSHAGAAPWRDVKVYKNHAYIVADALPSHGLQIFDLTQLRDVVEPPVLFAETAVYRQIGSAHNIFINEETGFAYVVGAGGASDRITCNGGLVMLDIRKVTDPSFAGCFSADGYTHDTQCVIYSGPDAAHTGQEICFSANEDTLTIADVSDKANPTMLARKSHPGYGYVHQGWLTADQHYFVMDDEVDEGRYGHNTRTYVWDVADLENPIFLGFHESDNPSLDHNLYIRDNVIFEANYTSGLRILQPTDLATTTMTPLGHFDTYPNNDSPTYNGAWSVYPFFASGTVIVSDINRGLFVVRPDFLPAYTLQTAVLSPNDPTPTGDTATHQLTIINTGNVSDSYTVAIDGNNWDTTSSVSEIGPLAPGESATIAINVTIGAGTSDAVSIILTSTANNKVKRVVDLITEAAETPANRLYLPIMKRQP